MRIINLRNKEWTMKLRIIKKTCILVCVMLSLILVACDSDGDLPNNTDTTLTITKTPDIPPYLVMIDGTRYLCWGSVDAIGNYEIIGKISSYTGDIYNLPEDHEQTNFKSYVGCDYVLCDNKLYLYYQSQWICLKEQ